MNKKAQKSAPSESKGRWHFVETYHSKTFIDKCLDDHFTHIVHYAYIFHNRDFFLEDTENHKQGDLKEPHFHVLLYLSNTRTVKTVQNWFDSYSTEEVANTRNPSLCGSAGLAFAYLTHKLNPEKTQYNESEIYSDNISWWLPIEMVALRDLRYPKECDSGLIQMYTDLLNGLSTYEMVHKWGKAYIVNSRNLKELIKDTLTENTVESNLKTMKQAYHLMETQCGILHNRLEHLKDLYREQLE